MNRTREIPLGIFHAHDDRTIARMDQAGIEVLGSYASGGEAAVRMAASVFWHF